MRKTLVIAVAAAALIGATALPASAAIVQPGGPNVVTFTLTGGDLTLTAATTTPLSGAVGDSSVGGLLGTVSVSDERGTPGGWTVSAISTVFTNGASVTVAGAVSYAAGASTAASGATFTPTTGGPQVITGVVAVGAATGTLGSNSASFNPTLTVTLPASGVLAGAYTGTVTTSIA